MQYSSDFMFLQVKLKIKELFPKLPEMSSKSGLQIKLTRKLPLSLADTILLSSLNDYKIKNGLIIISHFIVLQPVGNWISS